MRKALKNVSIFSLAVLICISMSFAVFSGHSYASSKTLAKPKITMIKTYDYNNVKLQWNKVSGAKKYKVYRKVEGGTYKLVKTTTKRTYYSKDLGYGKKYSFKIKAVNKSGKTTVSKIKSANTYSKKPVISTAKTYNYKNVKLQWKKTTGAVKYKVYRKTGNGSYKLVKTTTKRNCSFEKLSYGKKYSFKIKAVTKYGKVRSSAVKVVNTNSAKTTLKAELYDYNDVKLTWNKTSGAAKYKVYRKKADGKYVLMKTVTGTTYKNTGLSYNTQYQYKVTAVTAQGRTRTSTVKKIVTQTKAPVIEDVFAYNENNLEVSWNKVDGAVKFKVYRKNADGSWKLISTQAPSRVQNLYDDTNLKYDTTYTYKVVAVDDYGRIRTSKVMSGKTYEKDDEDSPIVVDPEEPVEPEDPVEPETPDEPTTPVDPEEPSEPEQPSEPEEPADEEKVFAAIENTNDVKLTWKDTGTNNYNIYRKAEGGEFELVSNKYYCEYLEYKLPFGKTYVYRVESVKSSGTAEVLGTITVKIPAATERVATLSFPIYYTGTIYWIKDNDGNVLCKFREDEHEKWHDMVVNGFPGQLITYGSGDQAGLIIDGYDDEYWTESDFNAYFAGYDWEKENPDVIITWSE